MRSVWGGGCGATGVGMEWGFLSSKIFWPLELEVPTICLVIGCVSAHRD